MSTQLAAVLILAAYWFGFCAGWREAHRIQKLIEQELSRGD